MDVETPRAVRWLVENYQHIIHHPFIISLGGASIAVFNSVPGTTRSAKAATGVTSVFCGIYGGPALNAVWGIQNEHIAGAIVLSCAAGGAIFIAAVFEWGRSTRAANWPIIGPFLRSGITAEREATEGRRHKRTEEPDAG